MYLHVCKVDQVHYVLSSRLHLGVRVLPRGQLNTAGKWQTWSLDGSRLTLDGRKVDVESLCHIVASSDGLYSTSLSPIPIPGGTFTDSLNYIGLVNLVSPHLEPLSMIYWWLGQHYLAWDTFSYFDDTIHHRPQQEHYCHTSEQL